MSVCACVCVRACVRVCVCVFVRVCVCLVQGRCGAIKNQVADNRPNGFGVEEPNDLDRPDVRRVSACQFSASQCGKFRGLPDT